MINPFESINWKPDRGEIRKFGVSLVVGGCLLCMASVICFYTVPVISSQASLLMKIFGVIAIVGVAAIAFPLQTKWIYMVWFFLAAVIGLFVSNVLLALTFYAVITPIGLVLRGVGHDPLRRKPPQGNTQWLNRKQDRKVSQYYRQS